MYQLSYAEIQEDDQTAARRIEAMALDRAVELLADAAAAQAASTSAAPTSVAPTSVAPGVPSREGIEALHYTAQLWMVLAREVAAPENALPDAVRAQLISIAIWILKEVDAIRLGRSTNYGGIADICAAIRDGLR